MILLKNQKNNRWEKTADLAGWLCFWHHLHLILLMGIFYILIGESRIILENSHKIKKLPIIEIFLWI